jgi:hypothetical protein
MSEQRERLARAGRVADWIEQALAIPGADASMALKAVEIANGAQSRKGELLMLQLYVRSHGACPEKLLRLWVERARAELAKEHAHV